MKKIISLGLLLCSLSALASGISAEYFLGKSFEGNKYKVEFASELDEFGNVQAKIVEMRWGIDPEREIPIVLVDNNRVKFYYDRDVENVQFFGISASLEKVGDSIGFCFPIADYQVDCLEEVK